MNSDCAFYIGDTHEVCEDYALASPSSIFLSDGCSSAVNTDIGSRILTSIAYKNVIDLEGEPPKEYISLQDYFNEVIYESRDVARQLGLTRDCLYATLLMARVTKERILFHAFGDGAIALGKKDGTVKIVKIDFPSNAPRYLAYRLTLSDRDGFSAMDKGRVISEYQIDKGICTKLSTKKEPSYDYEDLYAMSYKRDEYDWVSIVSDGVFSFLHPNEKEVPLTEVFRDLFCFKNFQGKFVQRRLKRFLQNYHKNRKINYDDISMAAINLG